MKKISVLVATVIVAMGITSCGDSHKSASLKTAAAVSYTHLTLPTILRV